jgi:O-antigen ligase
LREALRLGLIGTVLIVGGLSVTVWAATRLANDSREI